MEPFHLVEGDPRTPWVINALHALHGETSHELFGEDQTVSQDALATNLTSEASATKGLILALPGAAPTNGELGRFGLPLSGPEPSTPWGTAEFCLPKRDNLHLLDDAFVQVRAAVRRQGVASALLSELRAIAAGRGRNTVLMWSEHAAGTAPAFHQVVPVTGSGSVPADAATAFALATGFSLAQVERQSRLLLPLERHRLAELAAQGEAGGSAGYRLVSWCGPTPSEYLWAVAEANRVISSDAPLGGIEAEPEVWDDARVRDLDEILHRSGRAVSTLALTQSNSEFAGFTNIFLERDFPTRARQFNTVVLAGHRGHRLGLWLKTTNLAQLATEYPHVAHIDTWNANENQHMLAINHALGFRLWALSGAWQLKTTATP
jgi:GNAT superfamily N-acetyltransferase